VADQDRFSSSDGVISAGGAAMDVIARELARDPQIGSRHTRRTYTGALATFEEWRAGRPMTKILVEEYAAHLQRQGKAAATINHQLSAIRWWARRVADLAADNPHLEPKRAALITRQAERVAGVSNVKGSGPQRGRHVSEGEVRALLWVCIQDDSPAGVRDAALISVAFATGMRRSELVQLELADVAQVDEGYELTIRQAKRNKRRTVAVYNGARDYLRDWLALRGEAAGPLFLAIRKGGAILDHGLGTQSLQEMLEKRAMQAGIAQGIGWHDARRTLAGTLLDNGIDLATVQKILGHSSPVTTAAYDRRPEETRRRALRGLHVPYLRRD
jgi:site-specific recombinase XerD